jgi:hypothetical protein
MVAEKSSVCRRAGSLAPIGGYLVQDRQRESCRFARAGLGNPDHVTA